MNIRSITRSTVALVVATGLVALAAGPADAATTRAVRRWVGAWDIDMETSEYTCRIDDVNEISAQFAVGSGLRDTDLLKAWDCPGRSLDLRIEYYMESYVDASPWSNAYHRWNVLELRGGRWYVCDDAVSGRTELVGSVPQTFDRTPVPGAYWSRRLSVRCNANMLPVDVSVALRESWAAV